jgi:hypothetical protein
LILRDSNLIQLFGIVRCFYWLGERAIVNSHLTLYKPRFFFRLEISD